MSTSYDVHIEKYYQSENIYQRPTTCTLTNIIFVVTCSSWFWSSPGRAPLLLCESCVSPTWAQLATVRLILRDLRFQSNVKFDFYQVISKRYQQTCRNRVVPWSVLASWCQGLCLTTSVEGEKLPKTQFWNETWCVTWMDYNWCDSNCWYWIVTFLLDQSHITVNPRSSLWEKHNG